MNFVKSASKWFRGNSLEEKFTLTNGLQLWVKSGDITRESAGGVVVGEDDDFSGRGAVAQALLKAGGKKYKRHRDQMKDDVKKNGPTFPIYSCLAGENLKYKYVLHAIITHNRKRPKNWASHLKAMFFDMVRVAEEKGLRDLVTPLLGTGRAKMPLNVILTEALDGLSMLQPKSLRRVTILEYDRKKAETIRDNVQEILSSGSSTDPQHLSAVRNVGNGQAEGRSESDKGRVLSPSSSSDVTSLPSDIKSSSMPDGKMVVTTKSSLRLGGFPDCGTIVIEYSYPNGVQGPQHPAPGQPYKGTFRRAFLPDNQKGRRVWKLLEKAFDSKLTFHLVQSDQGWGVEFADIPHKTSLRGGASGNGYPDPRYLSQVDAALKKHGLS